MLGIIGMIILVLLDSFAYGFIYETKIRGFNYGRGIFGGKIWDRVYEKYWGFWNWMFESNFGTVKKYLVTKSVLQTVVLAAVFVFGSPWETLGILWGLYWMMDEYMYFVSLGQLWVAKDLQYVNWLSACWRSGYWIFKPYRYWLFRFSAVSGLIGWLYACLIKYF